MRARTASILAWSALAVAGLLEAVNVWLAALNAGTLLPDELAEVAPRNAVLQMPAGLAFLVVGALIVARRPTNRIGLVLLAIALGRAVNGGASQYAPPSVASLRVVQRGDDPRIRVQCLALRCSSIRDHIPTSASGNAESPADMLAAALMAVT
jgi:hypothetical protein